MLTSLSTYYLVLLSNKPGSDFSSFLIFGKLIFKLVRNFCS